MKYILKNKKEILIREVNEYDAQNFIAFMKQVDKESRFLAREVGEFDISLEKEIEFLKNVKNDKSQIKLVAYADGKLVGQISACVVRNRLRYLHRAEMAIMILKEYNGMGIGGKLIQEIIHWCQNHNPKIEQVELNVVTTNEKAIKLYKSFGFVEYGKIPNALKYKDGQYADEFYMVKFL